MSEECDLVQEELFNEFLIEEVQKHECIYNNKHADYGKGRTSEEAWSAVATSVGSTDWQCKKRWNALVQHYVKEYLKMTSVSSATEKYIPDWQHMGSMDFMKNYIESMKSNFNEKHSGISKRKDMFCRACLRPIVYNSEKMGKCFNLFETSNLCEKFTQCTNLKSLPWDEYPHSVCKKCYTKILDFHQFQNMCRDSLQKFHIMMENEPEVKSEVDEAEVADAMLDCKTELIDKNAVVIEDQLCGNLTMPSDEIKQDHGDDPLAEHPDNDFILEDNIEDENSYLTVTVENWNNNEEDNNMDMMDEEAEEIEETAKDDKSKTKNVKAKVEKEKRKPATRRNATKVSTKKAELPAEDEDVEDDETQENSEDDDGSLSDVTKRNRTETDAKRKNRGKFRFKCDICPKGFYVQSCFEAHQRRHQGLSAYACTYENCDRAYNCMSDFKRHLNVHKGIPKVFKCDIDNCDKVYTSYSGRNLHKRRDHKCGKVLEEQPKPKKDKEQSAQSFVCETCGKVLANYAVLKYHRLLHVDKSQWPFVCDEKGCERRYRALGELKIHKMRHAGIKRYACPHCDMRKTTRHELNTHINYHTFEKKYPCRICSKIFKSVGILCNHIRNVHRGQRKKTPKKPTPKSSNVIKPTKPKAFECCFCGLKLSSHQNKVFHEMEHRGEKPHVCDECGKAFTNPDNLKLHAHAHLKGDKPYVCEQCGAKYKWPGTFRIHMKSHVEGGDPYPCAECGRRFKSPSTLKSHMKLHSDGATPYKCEECGKGFAWPGSYYRHKKTHGAKETESGDAEAKTVNTRRIDEADNELSVIN